MANNSTSDVRRRAITTEVIGNALASIVDEMSDTLIRASYSTTIKERRDCSTALFTPEGATLAQATHVPMHLGSLHRVIGAISDRYQGNIQDGDLFIANDAYSGGSTQLAEIVLAAPIYHDRQLVAWSANVAHHADFVDRNHDHIFQEGIRIPPVRLHRARKLQTDVLDILLLNCQVRGERLGDLRAQIASNRVGIDRFRRLCDKFTEAVVSLAGIDLIDSSDRQMRAGISEIPDGEYSFADTIEDASLPIGLRLSVVARIAKDEVWLDFSNNPEQVRCGVNAVRSATLSAVGYAFKSLACPDAFVNDGLFRPIHLITTPGSVVDSQPPAAVDDRILTCQRVVEVIFGALSVAIPDRIVSASGDNSTVFFSGIDPRTGSYYVLLDVPAGGAGARSTEDGLDGVQVHLTNTSNLPVEALEQEYPLLVESYELVPDSGGAGRFRGGLGVHRRIRVLGHEALVRIRTSRRQTPPWGLAGGQHGELPKFLIDDIEANVSGQYLKLHPNQSISILTAGGGGYGLAVERDRNRVARDLMEGKISPLTAARDYGFEDLSPARRSATRNS